MLRLDSTEKDKDLLHKALRILKSLQISASVADTEFTLGLNAEPGIADSGELDRDLADLMQALRQVARASNKGFALLIDELQYLSAKDFIALIVSMHQTSQRGLPILFAGAGLPTLPGLSGNAKSYAERLFNNAKIGQLSEDEAIKALQFPAESMSLKYKPEALKMILERTTCYPYFLQEWGNASWNAAQSNTILASDVDAAATSALKKLDESFFRMRLERLAPAEKIYLRGLAELGAGSHTTSEISALLK